METIGTDGRKLGRRAQVTKSAILQALKQLLNQYPAHNLHIRNVTDLVGCSAATFWQYFAHLDDAFRSLAEETQPENANELWARQARHIVGVLDEVKGV